MYRSFVTCDDPKGVVDCGTIRKSKSTSSRKMDHNKNTRSESRKKAHKGEKDQKLISNAIFEEYHSPSSFQVREVSRGAQKLNQMIDSWSNGWSYEDHSEDIAKDLLKGALDLQESLVMLGKLQEASHYMARLKKKQKEKQERGRIYEMGLKTMNLNRFGDQNYRNGFQKPRLSADGSSRDCIDELKEAITDSFARQNLLPNGSAREKMYYDRRKRDLALDIPSTSSSQSSVVQSRSNDSTDCISVEAPPTKGKGSNLIAKLMGLAEMPSKPLPKALHKLLDMERDLTQRKPKPVFDIEMPKVRRTQPSIQMVGSEQKTLKDILETMQFKGLLKSHSVRKLNSWHSQSTETHTNQRTIDDMKPIVLIKPCVPCLETKEAPAPVVYDAGVLNAKLVRRNMKSKAEGPAPRSKDYGDRSFNSSKMKDNIQVNETSIKMLGQERVAKDRREELAKPEEPEIKTIVQEGVAVSAKQKHRKVEPRETPIKRDSKEGVEHHKEVVVRTEEDRMKTKLKGSSKLKASSPATQQQQKREVSVKKVNKIQKEEDTGRKAIQAEIVKPKNVSRSQDEAKVASTKLRIENESITGRKAIQAEIVKPKNVSRSQDEAKVASTKLRIENESITTETQVLQQSIANQKSISKHRMKTKIHGPKDHKKQQKPVAERTEKPTAENFGCKEDDKRISFAFDNDPALKTTTNALADQPSTEEEANISKFRTEAHCSDSQSSPWNHTLLVSEHGKDAESPESADDMRLIRRDGTSFRSGNRLKSMLLSSPSFLARAEELFHLDTNCLKIVSASDLCDFGITEMELSLGYAYEYIERRSRLDSQTRHPWPQRIYAGNSRSCVSLDKLINEVVNGIETLESYSRLASDNLSTDGLYFTLERDMMSCALVSGTWDLGWKNGFSVDEAEQTVNDIEKSLLGELIEEAFMHN